VSLPPGARRGVAKTATFGKVAAVMAAAIAINIVVTAVVMNTLLILISNKLLYNVFNDIVLNFGIY
jgi:hypothetical protein